MATLNADATIAVALTTTSGWRKGFNIVNPINSAVVFTQFGWEKPCPYANADAAYSSWCATHGFSDVGTDFSGVTTGNTNVDYNKTMVLDVGFPVIDGGTSTYLGLQHGAGIQLSVTEFNATTETFNGDEAYNYFYLANSGIDFYRVTGTELSTYPLLTIGADTALSTFRAFSDVKIRHSPTSQVVVGVMTLSRASDATAHSFRFAFRIKPAFLETVLTVVNDSGFDRRFKYIVSNETTNATTSARTIGATPSLLDTTTWARSEDLSELRVQIRETVGLDLGPAQPVEWTTVPVVNETPRVTDSLGWAWGLVISQTLGIDPAIAYAFRPGASVLERARLTDALSVALDYYMTIAETTRIVDTVNAAFPRTISETIGVDPAVQTFWGLVIAERMGLGDALARVVTMPRTVAETMRFTESLGNFFGEAIAEGLGMARSVSAQFARTGVVSENITLTDSTARLFLIRVTAAEGIGLDDLNVPGLLLQPSLAEGIEIAAAYLSPGDSAFTTWAVNTRTGAVTEYSNYVFNSFARMGNKYVAASRDGLFELLGDDDAGTSIVSRIKSGFMQFNNTRFSSLRAAYLGVRGEGDFVLRLLTGDGKTYDYAVSTRDMRTTKVHFGKGLRARYFAFELISEGQDFDIDTIEFVPILANRRV